MSAKKPTSKTRPLFTVKAGSIKAEDIARVEKLCGICILEIAELHHGEFVTAPPVGDVSMQARAAMEAMLVLVGHEYSQIAVSDIARLYTKLSIQGPTAQVPP